MAATERKSEGKKGRCHGVTSWLNQPPWHLCVRRQCGPCPGRAGWATPCVFRPLSAVCRSARRLLRTGPAEWTDSTDNAGRTTPGRKELSQVRWPHGPARRWDLAGEQGSGRRPGRQNTSRGYVYRNRTCLDFRLSFLEYRLFFSCTRGGPWSGAAGGRLQGTAHRRPRVCATGGHLEQARRG